MSSRGKIVLVAIVEIASNMMTQKYQLSNQWAQ